MNGVPDRRYFARVAGESGFRAGPLETVFRLAQLLALIDARLGEELYPPPSPLEYGPGPAAAVRAVRWRSEVVALARRPIPVTLERARERAAAFLGRATDFGEAQRTFLAQLELGRIEAERLPGEQLPDRVARNPALLWRLARGAEQLEER